MLRSLEPSHTELMTLCTLRRWREATLRAKEQPSEANVTRSTELNATVLSVACRGGADLETIQCLVEACPGQLRVCHSRRGTVLHESIRHYSRLEIVRYLLRAQRELEKNRDVPIEDAYESTMTTSLFDLRDFMGKTPLHCMVSRSMLLLCKKEHGTQEECCHCSQRSLLMDVMRELICAYPDAASASDADGETPLTMILSAPSAGNSNSHRECLIVDLVQIVLLHNRAAAIGDFHRYGEVCSIPGDVALPQTPLSIALSYGRSFEVLKLLVESAPQSVRIPVGSDRELPIHIAVSTRAPVEVIALLLEAAPYTSTATDKHGLSPMCWAWIRHVLDRQPDGGSFVKASKRRYLPLIYPALERDAANEIFRLNVFNRDEVIRLQFVGSFWEKMELLLVASRCRDTQLNSVHNSCQRLILHAAASVCCPRPILTLALKLYRAHVRKPDERSRLPLHCVVARPLYKRCVQLGAMKRPFEVNDGCVVQDILSAFPVAAGVVDDTYRLPLHIAIENDLESAVMNILWAYPSALSCPDAKTKLYPFMQAASRKFGTPLVVFRLLLENPALIFG